MFPIPPTSREFAQTPLEEKAVQKMIRTRALSFGLAFAIFAITGGAAEACNTCGGGCWKPSLPKISLPKLHCKPVACAPAWNPCPPPCPPPVCAPMPKCSMPKICLPKISLPKLNLCHKAPVCVPACPAPAPACDWPAPAPCGDSWPAPAPYGDSWPSAQISAPAPCATGNCGSSAPVVWGSSQH